MKGFAYYNEFDKHAVSWLRELIKEGLIANGEVDNRSILDVVPADLAGYTQHHFFAGIGGWSYALRLAGWQDEEPVWTASLPCQPFSIVGVQKGIKDERHLWPIFDMLISECKPNTIFGEQVEKAIKHEWLDHLQTNLEGKDYAVGHCILGAHSVNSAHIRQRLYWVANASSERLQGRGESSEVGYAEGWEETPRYDTQARLRMGTSTPKPVSRILCRDGKCRPIEPSIAPMVDGVTQGMVYGSDSSISPNETQEARVMRIKGYGNAIVPQVAAEFIKAFRHTKL